jgi:DNA-binding transcriptional LysR family regulator
MDVQALQWFQQVVDGVTVTEVADTWQVSQPGVSRALARLEREVGAPLLHRSGRVLRATHAGTVFKRYVDAALHELDDGHAAVSELVDPRTGTVSLAFQLSLGVSFVPGLIDTFLADNPQVRFRLVPSRDELGSSMVAGGRIDLEVTARRPRNPAVHWHRLLSQPLYLAVPPGHPLARRTSVSLAEVADDTFVMLDPTWELRDLSDELCAAAGFTPRVGFEVDDLSVVRGFVGAGLGVGIVPAFPVEADLASPARERLVLLSDAGAHRDVGVAWSEERRLLPSAALFREHVLSAHR